MANGLPPANVDFGLGDVTGGVSSLKNIISGGGISPLAPISFVNLAAKLFGRESNLPKRAATDLLSKGYNLLSRQMTILNKSGLKDTALFRELESTRSALAKTGGTGDFARISAFEPRLMKTLTKAMNVIAPVPGGLAGMVKAMKLITPEYLGNKSNIPPRYAGNTTTFPADHPLNILSNYLGGLERKKPSFEAAPRSGITRTLDQKVLAQRVALGKKPLETVWPYSGLDYDAIKKRYEGLGIEDDRGTTIPHTEYKFGEVDPNEDPNAPNIHTPFDGEGGGIDEPAQPPVADQPGQPPTGDTPTTPGDETQRPDDFLGSLARAAARFLSEGGSNLYNRGFNFPQVEGGGLGFGGSFGGGGLPGGQYLSQQGLLTGAQAQEFSVIPPRGQYGYNPIPFPTGAGVRRAGEYGGSGLLPRIGQNVRG